MAVMMSVCFMMGKMLKPPLKSPKRDKYSVLYVHRVDIIQSLKADFTFATVFKDLEDIVLNKICLRERYTPENYTLNLKYSQ